MILGPWRLPKSGLWGYFRHEPGRWLWTTVGTYEETREAIRVAT